MRNPLLPRNLLPLLAVLNSLVITACAGIGYGGSAHMAPGSQGPLFRAPPPSSSGVNETIYAMSASTGPTVHGEMTDDPLTGFGTKSRSAKVGPGHRPVDGMHTAAPMLAQTQAEGESLPTPSGGGGRTQADGVEHSDGQSKPPATEGRARPLLIYEGQLWMAVFEVEGKQVEVLAVARELGGFLSQQTGRRLVVRVPAERFQEAVRRIESLGDIVDRNIRAEDVTDKFRDIQLRLRNAIQVRDRLAALLQKADDVNKSLAIEKELDRITERIEVFKGQLKSLSDRLAYSTITVEFGVKPQPQLDPDVRLPFPWLDTLGLSSLLEL